MGLFFYLNDLVINIISFLSIHVANAKLPHISKTDSFTFVKKKKVKITHFPSFSSNSEPKYCNNNWF